MILPYTPGLLLFTPDLLMRLREYNRLQEELKKNEALRRTEGAKLAIIICLANRGQTNTLILCKIINFVRIYSEIHTDLIKFLWPRFI